jgi:anti-sigma factor RsiW
VWFDARALALAASVSAVSFAVGAGLMTLRMQAAPDSVAAGLVSDFARGEIAGQPFDVASSDRHTVKPWLAAHAALSAQIADLADQGFTLDGGRIAIVDRVPAPTLVYRKREHLIAVTELPTAIAGARGGRAIETIDGFHVARWSDANLSYVAVSDIDEKDLAAFVEAFKQAAKPAGEAPAR